MLLFFQRIFRGKIFEWLNWCLIASAAVWTIGFVFAYAFDCGTNFQANWGTMQELNTKCDKMLNSNLANAATDVAIDILIILLPIPFVRKLPNALGEDSSNSDRLLVFKCHLPNESLSASCSSRAACE